MVWMQLNRTKVCGTWRSKGVGGELKLSYGGKGESHKQEDFWGATKKLHRELTTELLYLELPTYFSLLWCKNIYALHKIPSY